MKVYLKVIGCLCCTCLPQIVPAVAQTDLKTDATPGTSTGAPQMDQRLLTNTWPKTIHNINIYKITSANTKKQNQARTILRVTTIA